MNKEKRISKETIMKIKLTIVAISCAILFAIAITPKSLQNDTFYTVKIGEYISQNGISDLTKDPFSWHELPYTFPHWLYDFIMYRIYNNFGWMGIYVSTISLASLMGILMYVLSVKLSKNELFSAIATILGMFCMKPYITARAQLVTFSLFLLTIIFIEKFMETGKKRYAVPLFIIPILIANLHVAVWPFYFVLYLPYAAEYLLSLGFINIDIIIYIKKFALFVANKVHRFRSYEDKQEALNRKIESNKKKRKENFENPYKVKFERNPNGKWLILIGIVCIATGLLTPIGRTTPYTYLYKTMQGNTTKVINEHLPLTLANNKQCITFLVVAIGVLTFTDVKIRARDAFFLAGLIVLTFMTRRQFSMLALIGVPIVCSLVANLFDTHVPEFNKKLIRISSTIFGCALMIALVFLWGSKYYKEKAKSEFITRSYPVKAADWMVGNLDFEKMRLFNEYNYGSYLLFRGIPVMIDSRCDLYTPEFNTETGNKVDGQDIFMDVQNVCTLATGYEAMFMKYKITHVISYANSKLSLMLKRDDNYRIIYNNGGFIIYERDV